MMKLVELRRWHKIKKTEIENRLKEFKSKKNNKKIFEELCFCILTANASARMGLKSIEAIKNKLQSGDISDIQKGLKGRHRFYNTRARYITQTRDYLERIKKLFSQLEKKKESESVLDIYNACLKD